MSTPTPPLQTIASICSTEPSTLCAGNNFLDTIDGIAATLHGTPHAEIGEKIREAVAHRADNPRPKTLPQVKEALAKIGAMIPGNRGSVPGAPTTNAERNAAAAVLQRRVALRSLERRATTAAHAAATCDSAIMDHYSTLKGSERFAFFQANRDALVREDKRRSEAARTALHADVVTQYLSLTGPARADFYGKHQAELSHAYRARASIRKC